MGQTRMPSAPASRALNGTEHAPAWVWIRDSVLVGKSEPIQFRVDRGIRAGADHGNLMRSQTRPERQQMSQHGGFAPRQEHFRLTHARGTARGQNYDSQRKSPAASHER
jgi:hypothetical protein